MELPSAKPLRLWPGILIVLLQWLGWFGLPALFPDLTLYGVLGGIAGGLLVVAWWLFFSRAEWPERIGAVAVMILAMAATWPFLHVSIATGAMGFLFPMLAMPGLSLALVLWAVVSGSFSLGERRASMVAAIVLACAVWPLVKTGGFTGDFDNDLSWRWTPSPEDDLIAKGDEPVAAAPLAPAASTPVAVAGEIASAPPANSEALNAALDWPGFRGRDRDGIVHGLRIATDWSASPPVRLWRQAIGPGWSSFAVHGDVFYTQEQRGEDEIVAAYRVSTGEPVWKHRDKARFWESNGGAGPRGTPTLHNGRVYALGATGILNVLDAGSGRVFWSRNVSADSGVKVPDWGFASSPLIVDDLVVVAAEGKLMAYELATGTPRWSGPAGGAGYSSPHLLTLQGVPQLVLLNGGGATGVSPVDGTRLWEFGTPVAMSSPIVQPARTPDGDLLVGNGDSSGMRRVTLSRSATAWTPAERWMSTGLKPVYNDFVVHRGHAFGFDGTILACIDLADGKRVWKGGRYGGGQLVLLADQDVLLVISEDGDLVLVSAATDKFTELARVPAIEGKTWNHPVVVGDILLVRNAEEMTAFRLATAER